MRQKLRFFYIAAVSCCLFTLCSRSDVITGAGVRVVTEMDSTLTNLSDGFARIDLKADAVKRAFSLPETADPYFSTRVFTSGHITLGINDDGDTLAAHSQHVAESFKTTATDPPYGKNDDEGLKAYLYFKATDTVGSTDPLSVYLCDTLVGSHQVNREDKGAYINDNGVVLSAKTDSIELPDNITKGIFDMRVLGDSGAYYAFAFNFVGYEKKPLLKMGIPYVIVHVNKDKQIYRDSISDNTARVTAFESAAEERKKSPYSSHHTNRTAVFEINVEKMLNNSEALRGKSIKEYELINAVMSIRRSLDSSGVFASRNIGSYKFVVLDTLLTSEIPIDSAAAANRLSLSGQFGVAASTSLALTAPFINTHSIKSPLRSVISKYGGGDAYIYVYLRPITDNSAILWENPSKIETIFTPSRLR